MMISKRWTLGLLVAAAVFATLAAGADTTHSILGRITTDGKPLEGVTVDFGGKLASVVTDDAGYYESSGAVEGGVYLLEPAAAGWTFAPARRAVAMGSGDEMVNFVAEPVGGPMAGLLFAPPTATSAQGKVNPYTIWVDAPDTGDVWFQGQSYNIQWHQNEKRSSTVWIHLFKGGHSHTSIATSTANDGSFWWKIPGSVEKATTYRVRIGDGTDIGNSGEFSVRAVPLVTYPSESGVAWRRGQAYRIEWQGFPGTNVKIQLYRGSLLSRCIAWSTPNDGQFNWTVPVDQRIDDNYKTRVTEQAKALVSDTSDRPFAIVQNPRVTYPTYSGVVWDMGKRYNITWRQFVCDEVKIDLIKGGTLVRSVSAGTDNDGSLNWKVPYDLAPGTDYKMRVRAVGNSGQTDLSNQPFRIRRLPAVTYPTYSGVTWNPGSPYTITWQGFASANVKIELLKNWAVDRVISNWTANDGAFKWWVPAGLTPGTKYRIRIKGTSGSTQNDASDSNFAVVLAPLVTYPTASGIQWDHGQTVNITWQGISGATVAIYLDQWGTVNRAVGASLPNTGTYSWRVVPGSMASGNGFTIRVVGVTPADGHDESNNTFRINAKPIVLSPNGGGTYSGTITVKWSGFSGTMVNIDLWRGGAVAYSLGFASNLGSVVYDVSSFADASDYRYRINSVGTPSEVDFSDGHFTIDN